MTRWTTIGLAALLFASRPASAQYIGIFLDPNASSCAASVGPTPRVDLHIIAILEGDVTETVGAEFRIVGTPETWTQQNVLWVPDVNTGVSIGNPLFPNATYPRAGVGIAFHSCQAPGSSRRVELGRIVLLGPPTADNVRLQVTTTTIWPHVPCPAMLRCDAPSFSYVCVGGGEVVLNGPMPASCQMAVEEGTWSNVKALYR